jgi:hypothetical protein
MKAIRIELPSEKDAQLNQMEVKQW